MEEGRGQAAGAPRGHTSVDVPGVLCGDGTLSPGQPRWARGMGGEVLVPVVLVRRKVMALSGMPHTLRTDTWQV